LLFGAGGNLGSAIHNRLLVNGHKVYRVAWTQAAEWLGASGTASRLDAIRGEIFRITGGETDILFAGGDTNPSHSAGALHRSNTHFPQAIISATATLSGFRYVTFGTIMEAFAGMAECNPYIASKVALGQWITNQTPNAHARREDAMPDLRGRSAHLQIHTLYGGGTPVPHMFLGQLVAALRKQQPFSMSAGRQLREYHHVDDIAGAVARLLSRSSWDTVLT